VQQDKGTTPRDRASLSFPQTAIELPSPFPKQRSRFLPFPQTAIELPFLPFPKTAIALSLLPKQRSRCPLLTTNSDRAVLSLPQTAIALSSPYHKQRSRFLSFPNSDRASPSFLNIDRNFQLVLEFYRA
jgi:hypothetical protein